MRSGTVISVHYPMLYHHLKGQWWLISPSCDTLTGISNIIAVGNMKVHSPFSASMDSVFTSWENRQAPATMLFLKYLSILLVLTAITGCLPAAASTIQQKNAGVNTTDSTDQPATESGLASWYGGKKLAGKRTASGERFQPNAMTAAHPSLPMGTKLLIHSPLTGRSVIVRVNDRGPIDSDRILDLSEGAAASLGIRNHGVSHITATVLPLRHSRFRHPTTMHNILQEEARQAEKVAQDSPLR